MCQPHCIPKSQGCWASGRWRRDLWGCAVLQGTRSPRGPGASISSQKLVVKERQEGEKEVREKRGRKGRRSGARRKRKGSRCLPWAGLCLGPVLVPAPCAAWAAGRVDKILFLPGGCLQQKGPDRDLLAPRSNSGKAGPAPWVPRHIGTPVFMCIGYKATSQRQGL